jgi:TRAP-type C4-dicarboxylate transport system permease small subunit
MRGLLRTLDRFELYAGSLFLAIMVTLLFIQIIFRFVFNSALTWSEEISRFAFLFAIYFAASWAAKLNGHIRVTALIDVFPPRVRFVCLAFSDLLWILFNLVVIKYGIDLVMQMIHFPMQSPVMGWSLAAIYSIIPLSFTLMTIRLVQRYYLMLKGRPVDDSTEVV